LKRLAISTGLGIAWATLTFILGAVQIIINYTIGLLQGSTLSAITKASLLDGSFLFFFQALVFSLIIEYALNKEFKIETQLLSAMLYILPIILFLFSIVLYFERLYDTSMNLDLFYSTELVIIWISGFYSVVVKSIFNYKSSKAKVKADV